MNSSRDNVFGLRPAFQVLGWIVVFFLLLGGGFFAYQQWTQVHVVLLNGLQHEYQVQYGELQISLLPGEPSGLVMPLHEKITLAVDYGARQENIELELDVTWSEFFSSRTVVVNPDRLATLILENVVYVREGDSPPSTPNRTDLFAGKLLYRWSSIDYPFIHVPDQIELKGSSRDEIRKSLQVMSLDPGTQLRVLKAEMGLETAEKALDRRLELTPEVDEETRLDWYTSLPVEQFKKRATTELAADPPQIAWHRAYQSLPEHVGHEAALATEYRAHLQARPDDPGWLYLLGRLAEADEARALFNRAIQSGKEAPWALHGLAWSDLCDGNFESALSLARRASLLAPEEYTFRFLMAEALIATGDLRGAAEIDSPLSMDHASLWASIGQTEQLPKAVEPFLAGMQKADQQLWKAYFETGLCYPEGLPCFEEKLKKQDHSDAQFWLGMIRGDAKLASESLGLDSKDLQAHLALTTIFPSAPETRQHLNVAAALLAVQGFDEAIAAKVLTGESYSREDLLRLVMTPQLKGMILLRAGRATGDREMLELASKLLFRPSLTQLLIRRELES